MKSIILPLLFLLGIVVAALSPIEAEYIKIPEWIFIIGGLFITIVSFITLLCINGTDTK